ncbi:hypothetical protein BA899_09660 [Spiribacter sp. SSL99]|uniref:Wzz/FepE/Etk N-terminal domain-containing protein n=1 Tax=Spiribacter sp. SSL99 TaxID=1866884 RepID=UPI00132FDF73|nr:Wzz/FepE/Etk N-terminal domain-containing protein [Spiribacter sp. SSL99]KAF0286410.1 hypothetical protein BA899_09660 [Spiribacter sp. SSL99]
MDSAPEGHTGGRNEVDDRVDVKAIFADLWRGKWIIIGLTVIAAVAGMFYAKQQPDLYTARALLVAPGGGDSSGGNLQGLAGLAGLELGGGGASTTAIAQEILKSGPFLTAFINRHDYAPELVATTGYTPGDGFEYDAERFNAADRTWRRNDQGQSLEPADRTAVGRLRGGLRMRSAGAGMFNLSFQSLSPAFAQDVVQNLVPALNDHMRQKDLAKAQRSVAYLEDKIEETSITGMRQVFFQLIESETRKIMLANANPEYVFETIDPAVEPRSPSLPNRQLIAMVATLSGALLGVLIVIMLSFFRPSRQSKLG